MSQNHGFKFLLQIADLRLHKGSFNFMVTQTRLALASLFSAKHKLKSMSFAS